MNVFAPDGLVARKEGSTWTHYTFDQQGTVVHKLDSSQTITAGRLLDAWGTGVETTLPRNIDPFGYNAKWGYYYDRETALYLCQNRMYDASAGRFINRDPIGYAGGLNLYGYCGGGPVGSADPSGLNRFHILAGILKAERCAKLSIAIQKLQEELTKRFYDMFRDSNNLFPFDPLPNPGAPKAGTWSGHQLQYRLKQIRLRKLLDDYASQGCGKPPRSAHKQANRPAPHYPGQPVPYLMEGYEGYDACEPISSMPISFPNTAYPRAFEGMPGEETRFPLTGTPFVAPSFGGIPMPVRG